LHNVEYGKTAKRRMPCFDPATKTGRLLSPTTTQLFETEAEKFPTLAPFRPGFASLPPHRRSGSDNVCATG
jgi:hypothetical protein